MNIPTSVIATQHYCPAPISCSCYICEMEKTEREREEKGSDWFGHHLVIIFFLFEAKGVSNIGCDDHSARTVDIDRFSDSGHGRDRFLKVCLTC